MSEPTTYRIRHSTHYSYSGRIDLCHSLAHLVLRTEPGQEIVDSRIEIHPEPDYRSSRIDYFGNPVDFFSIQGSHESLEVVAHAEVRKSGGKPPLPKAGIAWDEYKFNLSEKDNEGIRLANYVLPTDTCPKLDSLKEYLQPSLEPGKDVMDVVNELMGRVNKEFTYQPGATDTSTPLETVMKQKKGVCQDFAHVMIGALRMVGIPIRYVSGYLETLPPPGKPKLRGADATHAWIEAYTPATGWVPFDPTNDTLAGNQHIKICHGRDYFDVQPVRGFFIGSGGQTLRVEVDVDRVTPESGQAQSQDFGQSQNNMS